jgi:bifunctional non-homologous end joining protein LigD
MAPRPKPIRAKPDMSAVLPEFIKPELATLVDQAPADDDWLHEMKLDGYRTAPRIDGGRVRMLTRSGLDWTARFRPMPRPWHRYGFAAPTWMGRSPSWAMMA